MGGINIGKMESVSLERIRVIYHNACGYKRVFYEILQNLNNLKAEELIFPAAVVNGMLSIELFIKFIYASNHVKTNLDIAEFYKGHQAWNLYKKLDRKTKGEIRKRIDDKSYRFMSRMMKSLNTGKGIYGDIIEWRYLTKNVKQYKIDFNSMIEIVNALYEISSKICCKLDCNKISLPSFSSPELTENSRIIINDKIYKEENV